jgi:hypothetical protein
MFSEILADQCAVCDKSFDTFLFEGFPICISCHNKILEKEKELKEKDNDLGS